jgi:hypothetical protein
MNATMLSYLSLRPPIEASLRERLAALSARLAREASPELAAEALAAPTAEGSLALLLAEQAASEAVRRLDPLAGAVARAAEARTALVEAAGGFLSAEATARLLGITRQAVDKRRAARRLLGIRVAGDWHYPAAQFSEGETVPGLDAVLAAMAEAGPWSVLDFLLSPDDSLGGATPLDTLRAGRPDPLRRLLAAREADAPG